MSDVHNSARYCDGQSRQHTVRFLGAGIRGADLFAAVAGQTCSDPLDCVALTEGEAVAVGEAWARKRTTMLATDLRTMFEVISLPAGWSNDGVSVSEVSAYEVDRAESIHALGQKSDAELRTLAAHFRKVAPLATVASNRQSSEAIVAACDRLIARRGAMVAQPVQQQQACAVTVTWRNDNPGTIANCLAARLGREPSNAELVAEVKRIMRGEPVAMVPLPCQQQQACATSGLPRVVRLADLTDLPLMRHATYSRAEMEAARAVMVARDLKFDNVTGVVSDRNGWLSRPSGYQHEPHATAAAILEWEFRPCIANSASRVARGYSA